MDTLHNNIYNNHVCRRVWVRVVDFPSYHSDAPGSTSIFQSNRSYEMIVQGFMGVTSAGRGHGSTFFFELPVYGPAYNPSQSDAEIQPRHQPLQPKPVHRRRGERSRLIKASVICEQESLDRSVTYVAPNLAGPSDVSPTDFETLDPPQAMSETLVSRQEGGDLLGQAQSSSAISCVMVNL